MSTPTILPQISIQPTYPSVLADVLSSLVPAEDIWISCYHEGKQSVHGKVKVTKERDAEGGAGVRLEAREGVEVEWVSSSTLKVSCPALHIPPTPVRFPRQSIPISKSVPPAQITSLSPSPDLFLLATGHPDGHATLTTLSPSGPSHQETFQPHVSDILSVRFFPSSQVILTASSDTRLQVLPVQPPFTPARTLAAHKRAVTDTAILGRGREILSCGKDGTMRWWDVGEGKTKRTFPLPEYAAANKMAALVPPAEVDLFGLYASGSQQVPTAAPSETTPLVAVALSSSVFTLFDLRAPNTPVHTSPRPSVPSSLHAIALSSSLHLTTGSRSGLLTTYDLRSPSSPLWTVRRNGSCIEDIVPIEGGLAVGTEDGLPWFVGLGLGADVREEWAGWECDAVRCVRAEGGSVWMGGDDGVVRRY